MYRFRVEQLISGVIFNDEKWNEIYASSDLMQCYHYTNDILVQTWQPERYLRISQTNDISGSVPFIHFVYYQPLSKKRPVAFEAESNNFYRLFWYNLNSVNPIPYRMTGDELDYPVKRDLIMGEIRKRFYDIELRSYNSLHTEDANKIYFILLDDIQQTVEYFKLQEFRAFRPVPVIGDDAINLYAILSGNSVKIV